MQTTMTDRRKTKEEEDMRPLYSDRKEDKMNVRVYIMRRLTIKKVVVAVVTVILVIKLLEIFGSSRPPVETPPTQRPDIPLWPYMYNPQGLDSQDDLTEILGKIKHRQQLMEGEGGPRVEKVTGLDKVKGRYESTGSLKFKKGKFYLDGKPFRIISGAMHYFRVMPQYWDDRMKKMKACGLNTLETYVSWNLHEDTPGKFNFQGILDVRKYIQLAQKNGLYVLFRPGPYICSEWDFGGLPAWLLKDPDMRVRSNYKGYQQAVDRFLAALIPQVTDLQHSNGGPIIAVQVENEFGSYSSEVEHLLFVKNTMKKYGIKEMFFTSDGFVRHDASTGMHVAPFYDEALPTVNFKDYYGRGAHLMNMVRTLSSDFPLVVMEFWSGWFDHWGKPHAHGAAVDFAVDVQEIFKAGASINLYMWHGGTNFGFMAGANWFNNTGYKTDVTSYDYIAPLSEAGDITPKYEILRALIKEYILEPEGVFDLPDVPPNLPKAAYGDVIMDRYMTLEDIITPIKAVSAKTPLPMESLEINGGVGQNYGFLLYQTLIGKASFLSFTRPVADRVQVFVNGIEVCVFSWHSQTWRCPLPVNKMVDENMLDILVEHQGRTNYVHKGFNRFNEERKGITGQVMLDDIPVSNWKMYPLEFRESYVNNIVTSSGWKPFVNAKHPLGLYEGTLTISATPLDTFIKLQGWEKGVVFINGFNLGRYWNTGPQKTLYVPAPVLKTGKNKIVIFELHKAGHSVTFQKVHEIGDRIPSFSHGPTI